MTRPWRWLLAVALAAAGAAVAGGALWRLAAGQPSFGLPSAATAALAADGMTPVGGRPAPAFRLVDQRGRAVSLGDFRGKVVILTFLDPVCWLDCPLQAQEMAAVDRLLGPGLAGRVALLAVAANPVYHSLADVQNFDRQEHLGALPNWTFATSSSLATLQSIWKAYYVDVSVPKNGMVAHSDLFYLIGPHGGERYLSVPEASSGFAWGTSQLLATYVARMLGAPAHLAAIRPIPLPPAASTKPIVRAGPVAVHFTSPSQGWLVLNAPPYQVLYATADGGAHWTDVGPPGISKRGGLFWSWGGSGAAWVIVRPYGWMQDATAYETASAGRDWATPAALPAAPAAGAVAPLAADGSGQAGVLLRTGLWTTADGGRTWRSSLPLPAGTARAGLSWASGGAAWVSGAVSPAGEARLWTLPAHAAAWHSVVLPVPARFRGMQVLTLPPVWSGPAAGGAAVVAIKGSRSWLWWATTTDGGRHWRQALPPVSVQGPLTGGVQAAGGSVDVLRPAAGGVAVWRGDVAQGHWSQVGVPVAARSASNLDFLDPAHGWLIAAGQGAPALWRTADGGRTWTPVPLPPAHA